MKNYLQHLEGFYREISEDPAITLSGICLYQCLFFLCSKSDGKNKVLINRREVEQMAKIGRTTYQKALKELQSLGYIKYTPSFNQFLGSMIEFYGFPETVLTIKVHNNEILLIPDKEKDNPNEYKIVKVKDEDVPSFLTRHQHEVIQEGDSIAEILMEFASDLEHAKT